MVKFNLLNIYFNSLNKYGSNILFRTPSLSSNGLSIWTYNSVNKLTNQFKYLFAQHNVKKTDRIVFIGNNSPSWFGANMASYQMNCIFVPVYKSQHTDVIEYIIKETEPKIIISSTDIINKINPVLIANLPTRLIDLDKFDITSIPELETLTNNPDDNSPNIILYTSGTTGLAKGVCLNHWNMCSNIDSVDKNIGKNFITEADKYFNFLPWSHIYGLNCELYYGMSKGASIFINDNITNLSDNMRKSEPSIICTVPKLLYGIYDKIESNKLSELITTKPISNVFGSFIKNKIFGPNLRFINSGGASISPNILHFYSGLNIPVYQGYGLSETSPMISINYLANNKIGSVGKILDCNDVKIVNDEICVRGTNVFSGYYKNQVETTNAFDSDGYFKTGDQGLIDEQGYLYITGRCKDLYKLSNGKYINPAHVENILMESEHIQQIFIYGDSESFNIGLIVSNSPKDIILTEIKKLSSKLKKYEIPEKILIVPAFTFEDKLLTPKLSLVRNNIYKKYQKQITELYNQA